jgi:hypothetical protein
MVEPVGNNRAADWQLFECGYLQITENARHTLEKSGLSNAEFP